MSAGGTARKHTGHSPGPGSLAERSRRHSHPIDAMKAFLPYLSFLPVAVGLYLRFKGC
jgi:hypothetical protein